MRTFLNPILFLALFFFSSTCYAQADAGDSSSACDYKVPGADISFRLANKNWTLDKDGTDLKSAYFFKRTSLIDSAGRNIIPAIMIFTENASPYKGDVVAFIINKQAPFMQKGVHIDKILMPSDKDYPLKSKNGVCYICSYKSEGMGHILYMIYLITKKDTGVQFYLDMTKSIAERCEPEFQLTIHSLKEID